VSTERNFPVSRSHILCSLSCSTRGNFKVPPKNIRFITRETNMPQLPTGSSDPISFTCTCGASSDGVVLLFYRYFAAIPPLSSQYDAAAKDPTILATFHTTTTQKYNLGGKIRIAREGFNITVAGTKPEIDAYIQKCLSHWSFSGLDLSTDAKRNDFFKPTPGGCACVFGGTPSNIRVTSEITPMGVTNYIPKDWDKIEVLSPEEFHEKCFSDAGAVLMDVRNHYESRIGYFVHPKTGEPAVRPGIRRFSQWPQYVKRHMTANVDSKGNDQRHFMTYCTGGIRCEKGARFLQENMGKGDSDTVCTLKGGITAYLVWMDEEIRLGKKKPEDSFFRGRNYVFDARGAMGLTQGAGHPVSKCHICADPSDRLSKCQSQGCHLVLVVCEDCEQAGPRCCQSCRAFGDLYASEKQETIPPRPICNCEKEREEQLWGPRPPKESKQRTMKTKNASHRARADDINIQVKIIE
jgi:predicted sulfurtransferase